MLSSLAWAYGIAATFISAIAASCAGTGGGALYMAIFLLLEKDAHKAVPLSKSTILGVALASLLVNLNRRHPSSWQKRWGW